MIPYIETHIVDHCNLKCKGCSHFSSLVDEPYFKDINDFEKELKRLVELDGVKILRIMGGEPLLHPQVIDFCLLARKYLPYANIVLVSNGILLPKLTDKDIQLLNNNFIELCISNYGLKLDINQIHKFKRTYFHEERQMYNICLDLYKEQDKEVAFNNCDLTKGHWYFLKNGRIYQCCVMANIDYFNKYFNQNIEYNIDDISIDIFTHNEKEILSFLSHSHDVCQYCNTIKRHNSYSNFEVSKKEIYEWIQ